MEHILDGFIQSATEAICSIQITEYILQVSMLCISFENSNKYCLTESKRFIKLQSVETLLLANNRSPNSCD